VNSPYQQMDPILYHVVGVAFVQDGQQRQCMYLVPANERDGEFLRWLQTLNIPEGRIA
jgi:hypothetical protein